MTSDRWQRVQELFEEALSREPADTVTLLDDACGDDDELRKEVESLLSHHQKAAATFMSVPDRAAAVGFPDMQHVADPLVGQVVAGYRIIRRISTGGMGMVYEAEQEHPKRTVALKVVSAGLVSPELLRRFEHEAQFLAKLDHPSIANVFEAGTFDVGHGPQPFFAMEFVKGVPLVEYADAQRLSPRQRLGLLANIADAVQHAHQKGVIHRDLKPANILVTEAGEPKILDFGVARATDSDIQATTLRTDVGQLIGTLPYMSPEQVSGDPSKLDTRSDVYAIGVIAYELLAGRLPYDVRKKMIHEAVRVIREDDPTPLSSIDRVFRGDIEIIIAKAMEKERERRYQSVGDLATDIRRYLNDEPIDARPPSTWYQVAKFAKRNRAFVGAILAILVVLLAGIVGTSIGLVQAIDARKAEAGQKARVERERAEATRQAEIAQAVVSFLGDDLLASAAPEKAGKDVTIKQMLDASSASLSSKFEDAPEVEAFIRATIGNAYMSLGEYEPAEANLTRACELRAGTLGKEHPDTLSALNNLGTLYYFQRRFDEAEPIYTKVLAARRRSLGDEHPDTLNSLNNLAAMYWKRGRYEEAEALFQKVVAGQQRLHGEHHVLTLIAATNLAGIYSDMGRLEAAESLYRRTLKGYQQAVGGEHPHTLLCLHNLAAVVERLHRHDEAESIYKRTLDLRRRILGVKHPDTLATEAALGTLYFRSRRYREAEELLVDAVRQRQDVLGKSHSDTLEAQNTLASLYQMVGRLDDAESLYAQTLECQRETYGNEDLRTLGTMFNLAMVYCKQARFQRAESLVTETLALQERVLGREHPQTLATSQCLGALYLDMDRYEDAYEVAERTLTVATRVLGDEHPLTLGVMRNLAASHEGLGRDEEAEDTFVRVLRLQRRVLGPAHPDSIETIVSLANLYEKLARFENAEKLLLDGFAAIATSNDAERESRKRLALALESLYDAWGYPKKKTEWHDRAAALDRKSPGDTHRDE